MTPTDQHLYEVAIGMIPGIGSQLTRQLVSYCGSPESVFKEKKGKLLKVPGIGKACADAIIRQDVLEHAEKEISRAEKLGVQLLFYTSKEYPNRMKGLHDAPALLYYKGNAGLNSGKVISIVGTRNATEYGKEMIEQIVRDLAVHKDLTIVSGLAYGIDVAAHKAALQHQIPTIGIMASGIDIVYPAMHRSVAQKMTECGGLITEYRIASKPEPSRFPARNRIIAGMSDCVLVIEAAERGGALITAEIANGYNKEIFAVPGNLGSKYSEGCNKLIRGHKAHILIAVRDIEYIMNWDAETATQKISLPDYSHLEGEAREVVAFLQETESLLLDELSWKSQIPLSRLASLLLNLEFEGIVRSLPGKKYKLQGM